MFLLIASGALGCEPSYDPYIDRIDGAGGCLQATPAAEGRTSVARFTNVCGLAGILRGDGACAGCAVEIELEPNESTELELGGVPELDTTVVIFTFEIVGAPPESFSVDIIGGETVICDEPEATGCALQSTIWGMPWLWRR